MAALYTSNAKPDSLKADAYILYTILGSYFKECKIDNTILEKRLFLNYKDLSINKQQTREEKIIDKVEKIGDEYLDTLKDTVAACNITFEDDEAIVLFYADKKVIVKARVNRKGAIRFFV